MMMVSATPLNPLLIILAVGLGIGLTALVNECAEMVRRRPWMVKRL